MGIYAMKQSILFLMWFITSAPAFAEVCDKVRPAWDPKDGPISQFDDLVLTFFAEPFGLIIFGLVAATVLLRKPMFTACSIILLIIPGVLSLTARLTNWLPSDPDPVWTYAISEGCVLPSPGLVPIVLVVIAAILAAVTYGRRLFPNKSPPP
jgi:hypothetical protein